MSGKGYFVAPKYVPKLASLASLSQAAPVQNTWYTVLDTVRNVEVNVVRFYVATTGEDLEVRATIDGVEYVGSQTAVAGTNYCVYVNTSSNTLIVVASTTQQLAVNSPCKARSFKLEIRKTSANGAGNLVGLVRYAKW